MSTEQKLTPKVRAYLVEYLRTEYQATDPQDVAMLWNGLGRGVIAYREGRRSCMASISGEHADKVRAIEDGPTAAELLARAGFRPVDGPKR